MSSSLELIKTGPGKKRGSEAARANGSKIKAQRNTVVGRSAPVPFVKYCASNHQVEIDLNLDSHGLRQHT